MSRRQVSIFINGRSVENTLKGIRSEKTKINNELQNMTLGTEAYQKKAAELRKINKMLNDHYEGIKGTESAWKRITQGAGKFIAISGVAFTAEAIVSYGADLFKLGSEMELLGQKAQTVWGEALPKVTEAAEENASAMGLTVGEYVDATTAMGDLLKPLGFTTDEAAKLSTESLNLAGALSEWTGGMFSASEVNGSFQKALLGSREELERYGINIKQSDVNNRLAEKGLSGLTGEMLKQAEAAVTLELITEQSTDAQKAFADSSGSLVRMQGELSAELRTIQENIANALIPVFYRLVQAAGPVVETIGDFVQTVTSGQAQTGKFGAVLKVLQVIFGNVFKITTQLLTKITEWGTYLFEFLSPAIALVGEKLLQFYNTQVNVINGISKFLKSDFRLEPIDIDAFKQSLSGAEKQLEDFEQKRDKALTADTRKPLSPTPDEIKAQKEQAEKLAEERRKQAEKEAKEREKQLQRLADITKKFQEEARLAAMGEDEAQLERIRLQFQQQIDLAKDLERQKIEEATALRIELERLQQEAIQSARFEQNEELLKSEMDAISDQIDAELELEEQKTNRILAEIERRHELESKKEQERQAEELAAQKKQFEEIATVASATGSIISSALQAVGEEAVRNTVQGKVLALIQIGLKTAEGIANAVAAGSAAGPFPANLVAIASGIAAVTSGIAAARQALQGTPAIPQRKEGGYVGVMGQDDGILYQARYVGRRKTGMITGGPALVDTVGGPVLANERGSEYFVNHRALQNPVVMDHVRAIDNIVRMRQFQAGGFTSPPSSPSEPASTGSALPVQELQQMTAAVQRLNGILSGGIVAVIDDDSVVDLRNRTQKLIDASGGVL
jgi:chemotaxis protein histidine kinase CheA